MQHAFDTAQATPIRQIMPPEPEPATARALWPTFLRRTLADDQLPEQPTRATQA